MEFSKLSLIESFNQYFQIELATSQAQVQKAQRIRYRVYCEELGYEPVDKFPDGFETDEYDEQSLHILITHRRSGLAAGCVRLVPTSAFQPLLPLEKRFSDTLDPESLAVIDPDRSTRCEISRLAVDPLFRRRPGEAGSRLGDIHAMDISRIEYRSFSLIAEAAFVAAAVLTDLAERTNVFALMEPFLARLLGRSGIHFVRVGRDIKFHGRRAPYFVSTETVKQSLNSELLDFYWGLRDELARPYRSMLTNIESHSLENHSLAG